MSPLQWVVLAALIGYLVLSVSLLRTPDDAFADVLTREDGVFEWIGTLSLFAASFLMVATLLRLRQDGSGRVLLLVYLAIALFLFVAAGEEISWGQRVLGIETPESIAAINAQNEINLHNLYGDENGQNASSQVYKLFWIGFGVLLPVLALWPPLGAFLRRHVPVVPIWVAALFVAQQLLWKPVQALWRDDPAVWGGTYRGRIGEPPYTVDTVAQAQASGASGPAGLSEVMESNVQVLLLVAAVCLYLGARRRRAAGRHRVSGQTAPGRVRTRSA